MKENGKVVQLPVERDLFLEEAAKYLEIAPQTLRNRIARGEGPRHEKRNGRLRFKTKDLDSYSKQFVEIRAAFTG